MKKTLLFLAFAAVLLTGCQTNEIAAPEPVEQQVEPSSSTPKIFRFTVEEPDTKASFGFHGDYDFSHWFVAVYPGFTSGHRFHAVDGSLVEQTDDRFAVPADKNTLPDNVGIYPYITSVPMGSTVYDLVPEYDEDGKYLCAYDNLLKYDSSTGLYSCWTYLPGMGDVLVAATDGTEDQDLHFKNVVGILKLSLVSEFDGLALNHIVIKGNNNEIISGEFTITFSSSHLPEMTPLSGDRISSHQFEYYYGTELKTSEVTDIYISFPPTMFENGITVDFETNYGHIVKKTSQPLNIQRSCIQPLSTLTLVPELQNSEIRYITNDGNPVQLNRLTAYDPWGQQIGYTNSIDPKTGEGVIRFEGLCKNLDISFQGAENLITLTSTSNPIKLSTCKDMFKGCTSLDMSIFFCQMFDNTDVEDFSGMFEGCTSLTESGGFNNNMKVKTTARMYKGCTSLTELGWDAFCYFPAVEDMTEMFAGCSNARIADLSRIGTGYDSKVDMTDMFKGCSSLYMIAAADPYHRAIVSEDTFSGVERNGCLLYPHPYDVGYYSKWMDSLSVYGWSSYMYGNMEWNSVEIYNSMLWVSDNNGASYDYRGINIQTLKYGIFTQEQYDSDPDACKSKVVDFGTSCSLSDISQINGGGKRFEVTGLSSGSYVLVTYYAGPGQHSYGRKETLVTRFTVNSYDSSLDDLDVDHKTNGNDYWN